MKQTFNHTKQDCNGRVIAFSLLWLCCVCFSFQAHAEPQDSDESSSWFSWWESQSQQTLKLVVAEPFVNFRSGPATGYPVFHIAERGEQLTVLVRKTDWIKVEDKTGRHGWVAVEDIQKMHSTEGQGIYLDEPKFEDFTTHPWEAGLLAGNFDESAVNAAYLGYWMTDNLSLELWGEQILGDASESKLLSVNLVHQIFPDWRISPFFTLGAGKIFIQPKTTLSNESERNEDILNAGVGLRYYLSNRYFLRFEFKDYKLFTNRENNEEASEWKLGLSVFF